MKGGMANIRIIVLALGLLAFIGCENPFRAGLGAIVDIEQPAISLTSPANGSFIQENQRFTGVVRDDIRVEGAWFIVLSHPGPREDITPEDLEKVKALAEWQELQLNLARSNEGTWEYLLPTFLLRDGLISVRLRIRDGAGNETETAEFVFQITNNPPRIVLSQPLVLQGDSPGELGGPWVNFGFTLDPPYSLTNLDRGLVADSRRIQGFIADDHGVYLGSAEGGRFPPQFRLWEVATVGRPADGIGVFGANAAPTESQLPWQDIGESGGRLFDSEPANVRFQIDLPDEPEARIFAVQVRAQSIRTADDGSFEMFTFPRGFWTDFMWDTLSQEQRDENDFLAFLVASPQEAPQLELWGLEDMFGPDGWDVERERYRIMDGLSDEVLHPFVTNRIRNDKSGAFTLRVRAWHEAGVREAMAFWVASDGSRGRFIWDPADTLPHPGWPGETVPTDQPFSWWGYGDPNLQGTRNFVFTWNGNVADNIPAGQSGIQMFNGSLDEWNRMFDSPGDYWLELLNHSGWVDHTFDDVQDSFEILIYAKTAEGTVSTRFTVILTIDTTPPDLAVSNIEGSPWRNPAGADVVNGVIRVHVHANDSRSTDTDLRNSYGFFERTVGAFDTVAPSREVMFLMVREAEADLLTSSLDGLGHPWPLEPLWEESGTDGVYALRHRLIEMPVGVEVLRYGPVFDGSMLIQTSPIYYGQQGYLPDGPYRLFIFARDNAFNVGRSCYKLHVEKESDRPRFDFGIGLMTDAVTDPNLDSDGTDAGFRDPGGRVRNRLRPGNNITFIISDDDSLDLRPSRAGDEFGIRMGFTGFRSEPFGDEHLIVPHEHTIWLSPAQINDIFEPQPVENYVRQPVRERVGTVAEILLLDLLRQPENIGYYRHLFREAPESYNRLPDGMYRISVVVYDDPSNKLTMPGQAAMSVGNERHFWVVVDNQPPLLEPLAVMPPNESRIASAETAFIRGMVEDENGPIFVTSFTVTARDVLAANELGNVIYNPPIADSPTSASVGLTRTDRTDIWQYNFEVPIHVNDMFGLGPGYTITRGHLEFEFIFEDRFGGYVVLTRTYSVDYLPPTISVSRLVGTFERPSAAGRMPPEAVGVISHAGRNAERLANRVIDFSVHAHDADSGVAGIRWWLLPANIDSPRPLAGVGGLNTRDSGGTVESFYSYPAGRFADLTDGNGEIPPTAITEDDSAGNGRVLGVFGQIPPPGGPVVIDTFGLGLPDGEYRLHVIAIDGAGNESRFVGEGVANVIQTIFLFDDEDRPYFYEISPSENPDGHRDVVSMDGLVVRGIVIDDDGFGIGMAVHPESLRIWLSCDAAAGYTDPDKIDWSSPSGVPSYWYGGASVTEGVLISGRNLNLNLNLRQIFPGHFNDPNLSDGIRYVMLKVQDAPVNKLPSDVRPGADAERRYRYMRISFMLDTSPPGMVLETPHVDYRVGNSPFGLVGSIRDANLETDDYGHYILRWRVLSEGEAVSGIFRLDPESDYVSSEVQADGTVEVVFGLPPAIVADVFKAGGLTFNPEFADPYLGPILMSEGSSQFELEARDTSGLSNVIIRDFIVDRAGPSGTIRFPGLVVAYPFPEDFGPELQFNVVMPEDVFAWWLSRPAGENNTQAVQGWHNDRRGWAAGRELPVVFRDGARATLDGTFTDTVSVIDSSTLEFWINGRANGIRLIPVVDGAGTTVRWTIPLTRDGTTQGESLLDGVHTIEITVFDDAGNHTEIGPFAFRLDSARAEVAFDPSNPDWARDGLNPPGHSVLGPAGRFPVGGNAFTLSGSAVDANLRDLRLAVRNVTNPGLPETIIDISLLTVHYADTPSPHVYIRWIYDEHGTPTLNWSFGLTQDTYADTTRFPAEGGIFEVVVIATDWNNPDGPNAESEKSVWTFVKDTASPAVSFDTALAWTVNGDLNPETLLFYPSPVPPVVNRFHLEGQTITGSATDNHNVYAVQARLWQWDWETGVWIVYRGWDETPVDLAGSPNNRNWRVPLRGGNSDLGGLDIADGLYRIQVRAMDSSWFLGGLPSFEPADLGNPVTLDRWVYFYYDRAAPEIAEDDPSPVVSSRYGTNAADEPGFLSFYVQVSDANRLRGFTASVREREATAGNIPNARVEFGADWLADPLNWESYEWGTYNRGRLRLDVPVSKDRNGRFTVVFTATDFSGRTATVTRNFELDNTPPGILIHAVDQPETLVINNVVSTGVDLLIVGEALDSMGPVDSLPVQAHFRIGTLLDDAGYPIPFAANDERENFIEELARRYAGVTSSSLDTARNNAMFDYHVNNVNSAWFRLDEESGLFAVPNFFEVSSRNLFNWQLRVRSTGEDSIGSFAKELALKHGGPTLLRVMLDVSGRPVLPISFRVVDSAGNAGYGIIALTIDMEADIPGTTIETPRTDSRDDAPMGGVVTIDGVASTLTPHDTHAVLFRVSVGQSHVGSLSVVDSMPGMEAVQAGDPLGIFLTAAGHDYWAPDQWFHATLLAPGQIAPWLFLLNTDGQLVAPGSLRFVRVEVIAVNQDRQTRLPHKASFAPEERSFYLRDTSPTIKEITVRDSNNAERSGIGDPVSGRFTISAVLDASEGQTIRDVRIARPGDPDGGFAVLWPVPSQGLPQGLSLTPRSGTGTGVGYRIIDLVYGFDPGVFPVGGFAGVRGGEWASSGGRFQLEIEIRDNTTPPSVDRRTVTVDIDNAAPAMDPSHYANPAQAGTAGVFQGRILDNQGFAGTANIPDAGYNQAIDRLFAWFTRNGRFVAFDGTEGALMQSGTPHREVWRNRRVDDSGWHLGELLSTTANTVDNTVFSPPVDLQQSGNWVRVLRRGAHGGDLWLESNGGRNVDWQFSTNTLLLPSGPITLHYIAVDSAGNKTYGNQRIVIMNNSPQINDVVLFTSNSDVPAVINWRDPNPIDPPDPNDPLATVVEGTFHRLSLNRTPGERARGYIESGFTVRNHFLGLRVETMRGNAPLNYRLQHVTRELVTLNSTTLQNMMADPMGVSLVTIAARGDISDAEWNRLGVVGDSPAGTHFVFDPRDPATGRRLTAFDFRAVMTGQIWVYTAVGSIAEVPNIQGNFPGGPNPPVLPNNPLNGKPDNFPTGPGFVFEAGDGFNFSGDDFVRRDTPTTGRIPEFIMTTPPPTPITADPAPDSIHVLQSNDPGHWNYRNRPFFLLRVWDSVDPGEVENAQLHDAVVMGMNVWLYDWYTPLSRIYDLNPYMATPSADNPQLLTSRIAALDPQPDPGTAPSNILRGGLFNTGTLQQPRRSGHVEPRRDSQVLQPRRNAGDTSPVRPRAHGFVVGDTTTHDYDFARDRVSGQVILRGQAWDNLRIQEVQLRIGTGNWRTILRWNNDTQSMARTGFTDEQIGVAETMDWLEGHTVEWSYLWNTEEYGAGPMEDVQIAVRARDFDNYTVWSNGEPYGSFVPPDVRQPSQPFGFHDTFDVDIVPYITGFVRDGTYRTLRSMQGWYSFYQGETGIRATGWNLGGGGNINMTLRYGDGNAVMDMRNVARVTSGGHVTGVRFDIPETAQSGMIDMTVNNFPVHNHRSNPALSWNRENFDSVRESGLWHNRPHAHIWRTRHDTSSPPTFMGPHANSLGLSHPSMALNYTDAGGRLYGTWAVFGTARVHYGINSGALTGPSTVITNNPPLEPFVTPDISIFGGRGMPNIVMVHQDDGNPAVGFRSIPSTAVTEVNTPVLVRVEGPTHRWRNPRASKAAFNPIVSGAYVDNNPGVLFVSVHDAVVRAMRVFWREGDLPTEDDPIVDGPGINTGIPGVGVRSQNSLGVGLFSAIGHTGTGLNARPIVAYYDMERDTIMVATTNIVRPTESEQWVRRNVLPGNSPLFRGAGRYVSMAVDRNGGIHLAFFNSRLGAVVYAFAESRDAIMNSAPNASVFTAMVVDTLEGTGVWTDISVDHWGNPWIVYGFQDRAGNFDGIRMAYRSASRGSSVFTDGPHASSVGRTDVRFTGRNNCPFTGADITGWEAVSMPAPFRVNYDRLNIEAWPPSRRDVGGTAANTPAQFLVGGTAWDAAIGYASDRFRIGYFFRPMFAGTGTD